MSQKYHNQYRVVLKKLLNWRKEHPKEEDPEDLNDELYTIWQYLSNEEIDIINKESRLRSNMELYNENNDLYIILHRFQQAAEHIITCWQFLNVASNAMDSFIKNLEGILKESKTKFLIPENIEEWFKKESD